MLDSSSHVELHVQYFTRECFITVITVKKPICALYSTRWEISALDCLFIREAPNVSDSALKTTCKWKQAKVFPTTTAWRCCAGGRETLLHTSRKEKRGEMQQLHGQGSAAPGGSTGEDARLRGEFAMWRARLLAVYSCAVSAPAAQSRRVLQASRFSSRHACAPSILNPRPEIARGYERSCAAPCRWPNAPRRAPSLLRWTSESAWRRKKVRNQIIAGRWRPLSLACSKTPREENGKASSVCCSAVLVEMLVCVFFYRDVRSFRAWLDPRE